MKSRWRKAQQVGLLALLSLSFVGFPILMNYTSVMQSDQDRAIVEPEIVTEQDRGFALASDEVYTEDFASSAYMDAGNTNATGWGTGTLMLPRMSLSLAASCATPDSARGIYVSGDYAYVADGDSGLQVVDITDPIHPFIAGFCATPSFAYKVYVSGDFAYVADDYAGLQVVNITDPSHPSIAGSCDTAHFAYDVHVSGTYAFIADGFAGGLQVINISDPVHPSLAGSCTATTTGEGVFVSGDYAYVAAMNYGLAIVDITDPTHPSLTSVRADTNAARVYVSGDYAYVADVSKLQVVDISNPTTPVLAGSCTAPANPGGIYVSGDYAYIADAQSGLKLINITDPAHPSLAGACVTPGYAEDVYVSGDYAYIANSGQGLQVVKIADYTAPSRAGYCFTDDYADSVYVSGDYAYIADCGTGLQVINITRPTHPSIAGSYGTASWAWGIDVSGDYAYVAEYAAEVEVVNITDPIHPTLAGSCATSGSVTDIYVSGNYAYIADYGVGLGVVNITDPSHPFVVGSYSISSPEGVCVSGHYAYVASYSKWLTVVNITDPAHPSLAGSCVTPNAAYDVYVSGDYAYVADGISGLQVINITDITQPQIDGSCVTPSHNAIGVYVRGNCAYVTDASSGLQVINITDPIHPFIAGACYAQGNADAIGVYVSGDYAYVAASGLQVIEVQRNRCREYASSAIAQSLTVYDEYYLTHATLQPIATQFAHTSSTYYLSADGGLHWELVAPGVQHDFVNSGGQLCWRAVLSTADSIQSPILSDLSILYNVRLDAPSLTLPSDGLLLSDNTPQLAWTDAYVGVGYLAQVDSVASFDSGNLVNITVPVGRKSCATPTLTDGVWYWRAAAIDADGDLGFFSMPWSMTIDATGPTWDQTPGSRILAILTPFRYDLNASDPSGISKWWINDTAHFAVDSSGVITNTTLLAAGMYGIQVSVNDTLNNVRTAEFSVIMQDTGSPHWLVEPTSKIVEFFTLFRYDLNASDPSGISKWWVNDTIHFTIDSSGVITNATPLAVGAYGIRVWVNDTCNNVQTAEFFVAVLDRTSPYWLAEPADISLNYGETLDCRLQAADFSGISRCEVNDTAHFSVDTAGHITNATVLEPGTYGVLVTVYDRYGNYVSDEFSITVLEQQTNTTTPTTTTPSSGVPLDLGTLALILGGVAGVVILVIVVVYTKRRASP